MDDLKVEKENEVKLPDTIQKAAIIASNMCSKRITTEDVYKVLIAVELSKESYVHKEDSIEVAIDYLDSLNDYLKSKT